MKPGERLKKLRNSLGYKNQTDFAGQLGITQTTLSKYENGTIEMPDEVKLRLSGFGVNLHWLLTGEGKTFLNAGAGISGAQPSGVLGTAKRPGVMPPGQSTALTENMAGERKRQGVPNVPRVPLLRQKVSCGKGIDWESEENVEEYLDVEKLIPRLALGRVFAMKAQGSSMMGVGILDGDYILFDASEGQMLKDGIYVFSLDGDLYCKRLEFDALAKKINVFSVRFTNMDKAELVKSIDISDSEFGDRFTIFGKVHGWIHQHEV